MGCWMGFGKGVGKGFLYILDFPWGGCSPWTRTWSLCRPRYEEPTAVRADITLVVFTGVGDFYSAGNDLKPKEIIDDMDLYIRQTNQIFIEMVKAFIDCPKVIICLVNGPCIGVAVTLAGLSDIIWCSQEAYFMCPFVPLGIVPESCSSYLFPFLLRRSKATELLLFGEIMSSSEAYRCRFVTKIFNISQIDSHVWPKLVKYSQMNRESLQKSKNLKRKHEKEHILRALHMECDALYERFYSEEFVNAVIEFSAKKSKI
ncbi:enoyl-CoA delta isomerase 2-like [Haematobia irritans]|uniref:enoyl-CoA delta isomerase 2-like n=1 Tax=Haematobia irritans TaxID=7368 RepID=UPI003F505244